MVKTENLTEEKSKEGEVEVPVDVEDMDREELLLNTFLINIFNRRYWLGIPSLYTRNPREFLYCLAGT